jgi:hypothetical protein
MVSMVKKVLEALEHLEVGQELDKKKFILLHWGYCDYFVERSFDVTFCKVKKLMPEKDFKSKNKLITRIK